MKDGLSSDIIWCIIQDMQGFLWFGTTSGLHKYDGSKFKIFRYSADDLNSISDNMINTLFVDKSGVLWIGTKVGGLNRYNSAQENFTRYNNNPRDSTSISSDYILSIYEDKAGILWVGTAGGGLNVFNREKEQFICYKNDLKDLSSISGDKVSAIYEDSKGNLWIGTLGGGLNNFDRFTRKFTRYFNDQQNPFSLSDNDVTGVSEDKFGIIWIATFGGGLNRLTYSKDKKLPIFIRYKNNPKDPESLNNNDIQTMHIDQTNIMWIGTYGGGLSRTISGLDNKSSPRFISYVNNPNDLLSLNGNYVYCIYKDNSGLLLVGDYYGGINIHNTKKKQFKLYKHEPDNQLSLPSNEVVSFYQDKHGSIWIGTLFGGLNKLDQATNNFINHKNDPNYHNILDNKTVLKVYKDRYGILWYGTDGDGLIKFDIKKKKIYQFKNDPLNPKSISENNILSICEDYLGTLWIGTFSGGLNKYDRGKEEFIHFQWNINDPGSLSNDHVASICNDSEGNLWIGTNKGLDLFDFTNNKFSHYRNDPSSLGSLSDNGINTIFEDKSGTLWIGTQKGGLNKFIRNNGQFKHYKMMDGLPSDFISDILEDDSGYLWISTNNGLSKFNPITELFRNYDVEDGLQSNYFEINTCIKSQKGELIFGGPNGFNIFYPDSIKDNTHIPPVYITDFYLFNKPVPIGYDSVSNRTILNKSIIECKEIELNYDDNVLSLEFAALDYHTPVKNQYAYMMEGFDREWTYVDANRNLATYTNLSPGDYIFKVKGSNNDGIWNEKGASIKIIILPPWWRTNIAYLFYILFIIGTIYFTWKMQLRRIKNKQEFEMSKFEAEKLHEVDELKSRFFANISHEFRTPLTLILGPAKDVIEKTKETDTRQNVGLIKRNASRLLGLVNQLLDLSKLEAGKMKLEAKEENIIPLLKGLVLSFSSLADAKKIVLNFKSNEEGLMVYLDKDKIEKIINNLLSNAFKFTSEGGRIEVNVEKVEKEVAIKISDSGIGIQRDKLDNIFDRFYQVDGSHTREQEGTGIGLALTKELVELHKGKIEVESEEGNGTTFTVKIPWGKDHLKPEEIVEDKARDEVQLLIDKKELIAETHTRKEKTDIDVLLDTDKPLLLVVEDNGDVRKYIISHLENDYRIQEAVDGLDGIEQAFNHIPDLIISDVMMPKMDGFEMCSKLKTDERTSHIPIIMLTAKATSQDKISGYETGADDYIMKPFDAAELKVRVKNLIEIRRKLQEKFRSSDYTVPSELSSIDDQFMKRVMKVINEHISEEKFSIDELGKEVGMSREHIYRKLKAISGNSPSLFIRSIRLAKAKKLIKERKGTISEISFLVGFSSPAYFGKCFKEEFGYSPGEI